MNALIKKIMLRPFGKNARRISIICLLPYLSEYINGLGVMECQVEHPNLLPNQYAVNLFIRNHSGTADLVESQIVTSFTITGANLLESVPSAGPYALGHLMHGQICYQRYQWRF